MKLLQCPICHDVHGLISKEWRVCFCGASGGQYNADGMTATLGGAARVFGVGNPFFNELYLYLDTEGKRKMRQRFYGQPDTDAWWGEYPGDVQIFRLTCPFSERGPRLKVKVQAVPGDPSKMCVKIIDKRSFTIDGKSDLKSVIVPANRRFKKEVPK